MSKEAWGIFIGLAFTVIAMAAPLAFPNVPPLVWHVVMGAGLICLAAFTVMYIRAKPTLPEKSGGRGGNASVGGSGIAIGGPGGVGGSLGRGGDGGGAKVDGNGIAVGGAGGHAADIGVWRPPAQSGYVVFERALGRTPDPNLAGFGKGGVDPEYYRKLEIVRGIERSLGLPSRHHEEADPAHLSEVNNALQSLGETWRARLGPSGHDYEFFDSLG